MQLFSQLFALVNGVPSPWNTILKFLLALAAIGFLLIQTVKFVPQGEMAMRKRFQKVVIRNGKPIYLGPGMHLQIPGAHSLERVSVLDRTFNLQPTRLRYSRYVALDVAATVTFSVKDIYLVRYAVDDFEKRVSALCEAQLRRSLRSIPNGDVDEHNAQIVESFTTGVANDATKLGIVLKALNITNVSDIEGFAIAGAIASCAPATLVEDKA